MSKSSLIMATGLAALILSAGPLAAQSQNGGEAASDPVEALLRDTGAESAPLAPPPEPDPEERVTRALNAEILAQSELADRERRIQAEAEEARYREQVNAVDAETARLAAAAQGNDAAYQDALARHERAMADWRATAEACRRGQTTRCRAGKAPAVPGNLD